MASSTHRRVAGWLALGLWLAAGPAAAQGWEQISPPPRPEPREGAALVYDRVHEHLVLFGGEGLDTLADTWILAGDVWTELAPETSPPRRHDAHAFWDEMRERVTIFGGIGYGTDRNEIWSWDGADWSSSMPSALVTPARRDAAVAYDSERDRIVLFGGTVDGSPDASLADTWEYDGSGWSLIEPAASPTDRGRARMGYDPQRKIVVLMGGWSQTEGECRDTWTWDGSSWTECPDAGTPVTSSQLRMTWDPVEQKLMLAGIEDVTSLRAWHFDGSSWIAHAESGIDLYGIDEPCLAFDESRGYALFFTEESHMNAGFTVSPAGDWSRLLPTPQPGGIDVYRGGFVFDTQASELRLFGESASDFAGWRWDGDMWRPLDLQGADEIYTPCCVAYDASRHATVVFSSRTFELVGDSWTERPSSESPPQSGAMAYHAGLGRVIYFGGVVGFLEYADETWEWDGSEWRVLPTGSSPPGRRDGGLAYDEARERLVLFGGSGMVAEHTQLLRDTWELSGGDWRLVDSDGPENLHGTPKMTYDPNRHRIVMWAEQGDEDARVWELDGSTWVGTDPPPDSPEEGQLGYDLDTGRQVLHLDGKTWARESGTLPRPDGGGTDGGGADGAGADGGGADGGAGGDGDGKESGCGCSARRPDAPAWIAWLALLAAAGLARGRRHRRAG
ncbi:MAG: hypothetical protein JXR96_09950 [Deltaproteobacteria bacterium]|nr:hypothetical protein [Deltaproteobacteria bacterium]